MSQVIYRKYRPGTFDEIVGQGHVVQTLRNAIKSGDIAHSYLFCGPRGTGKTTMARILARELKCADIDIAEIDAASNRGIDEIRSLREAVRISPAQSPYKVYIIDEVHMLTKEAFNALLKTLEEPPEHVIFIMATTEPHKVPATIISRSQRFDFHHIGRKEMHGRIESILKKENKILDDASMNLIVTAASGSMRDAESMLGKVLSQGATSPEQIRVLLGVPDIHKIAEFFELLASDTKEDILQYIQQLVDEGNDFEQFTDGAINYARTLLILSLSPSSAIMATEHLSDIQRERAQNQASLLTEKKIYAILKELLDASQNIKYSPIPQLPLELAVVNLLQDPSA